MVDQALGLALVFNGTIYNDPALRVELMALGYRFRGYHMGSRGVRDVSARTP